MNELKELRKKSNAYVANLNRNIELAIIPFEHFLIKFQTDQWLKDQIDSKGNPLPLYSPSWKKVKGISNYNLYDTGSFQNKVTFSMNATSYLFDSTDRKKEKIEAKTGKVIWGLAPSYRPEAKLITTKAISIDYKRKLGL